MVVVPSLGGWVYCKNNIEVSCIGGCTNAKITQIVILVLLD
jgi:hypothetical protein